MKHLRSKKAVAPLFIVLAAAILVYAAYSGYIQTGAGLLGQGSYIERSIFKYIKCEPVSEFKYSQNYDLASNGEWINKPSVSSSYNVKFTAAQTGLFGGWRLTYSVCNSQVNAKNNCRIYNQQRTMNKGDSVEEKDIKNNEVVYAIYETGVFSWKGTSGAIYQIGWVPYGLREYDVLSGSPDPVNPNDCETPSTDDSWKFRLISSDSQKLTKQTSKNVNERVLQPEEVRWYVSGYVTSAAPSFVVNYKGQDAWCRTTGTSAEIYRINTANIGGGSYKIASADWSDYLGAVTCCPGQSEGNSVCQSDFTWKAIEQSECGPFKSCGSPNWVPYSEKVLIKYSCVNGKCKSETKNVECANDYDCKDSNKVCDLNSHTCVNANVNLAGQEIKTIPDNVADCEKSGGTWMKTTSSQKSIWNYLGIGSPKIIINEYCKMPDSWSATLAKYAFWIIVAIIMIIALKFLHPVLKSIPYVGKFIP